METEVLVDVNSERKRKLIGDVLSQAITGELIGMSNFASLAETIDDWEEKIEAVEHADSERMHAEGFIDMARKYGIEPIVNLKGTYWHSMRQRFLKYAAKRDFIACLIIQEVMLESFAVAMYRDTGEAIGGDIGALLVQTAEEERGHLEHSTEILRAELERDGDEFVSKFHKLHLDCMTVLAEWSANSDIQGHCGICNGTCMKEDLDEIGLNIGDLRANALKVYAEALDNIGLPTEKTTLWIMRLPI